MLKLINSQARVWGKHEEDSDCFLQCANHDQKILILQNLRECFNRLQQPSGMGVPTLRKRSSFWNTACGGCNRGPRHAQKPFSMENIESLASCKQHQCSSLSWSLNSDLSWLLGRWPWAKLALEQQEVQYKAKQVLFIFFKSTKKINSANPCLEF